VASNINISVYFAFYKVIRRDIARTYPEHEFFKEKDGLGQESLFNVMKAYSLHDREVGYCQGSAFIVGLLLMQMPEEEAFAVVVKLMQVGLIWIGLIISSLTNKIDLFTNYFIVFNPGLSVEGNV